jgi:H+-transporting ATPase
MIFGSLLIQPMPIMIWLAALVELLLSSCLDMGILLIIQFANASIGFYEIVKADDAVATLKASFKPKATVKRDGAWVNIEGMNLVPGDLVLLASGSSIPADCRVNHGTIEVDHSQFTGESLPVLMYDGSSCFMGTTVVRGETEGTVEFTGVDTYFGKSASLLQSSSFFFSHSILNVFILKGDETLSNLQKILINIVIVLVVLAGTLCTVVFLYLVRTVSFENALSYTEAVLIASIPLAIEIVTTTTLALDSNEQH